MTVDLSICIVTHRARELLQSCLRSIYQNTGSITYEIIVVDNNSQDGTVRLLREDYPDVLVIENDYNAGFTRPSNQALRKSHGRYAILLNNDTVIFPGAFDKLIQFADARRETGICGPKVLNSDGSLQEQCHRSFPTPWISFAYFTGLARLFPHSRFFAKYQMTYLEDDEIQEVDSVSGSCMMIRREVMEQIGLLDETCFAYGEDIDYCFRAKKAGWKIFYFPQAQIIHHKGKGGSGVKPARSVYEYHRAMVIYYRKHLAKKYVFFLNWLVYGGIYLKLGSRLLINLFRKKKMVGTK